MKKLILFLLMALASIGSNAQFIGDHYSEIARIMYPYKAIQMTKACQIYKDTTNGWYYAYGFNTENVCVIASYGVPDSDFLALFHKADSIFNFRRTDGNEYYDTNGPYVMELVKIQEGYIAISFIDYSLYMYLIEQKKKNNK